MKKLLFSFLFVANCSFVPHKPEPVWFDNAHVWVHLPIRVKLAPDLTDYVNPVRESMKTWNREIGCKVFEEAKDEYDVRIVFLHDSVCDKPLLMSEANKVIAATWFCPYDEQVDIEVNRLDELFAAYRVFSHEFGHILGLTHDNFGIMAPELDPEDWWVFPSETDAQAVRERYCQ